MYMHPPVYIMLVKIIHTNRHHIFEVDTISIVISINGYMDLSIYLSMDMDRYIHHIVMEMMEMLTNGEM